MALNRNVVTGLAIAFCACFAWPHESYGRTRAPTNSPARGVTHLYILLGLGNNSPGLSEFGNRMERLGVPTTVGNHGDWPTFAQEAIEQYKVGRLRSIEIVGHSLGGDAAVDMAEELGRAGIPVELVVTLDPTGSSAVSANVRHSVNFVPRAGEDHFTMIVARERDIASYVLGGR